MACARAASPNPLVSFVNESNGTLTLPSGGFYLNVKSEGQCGCYDFYWAATIAWGL